MNIDKLINLYFEQNIKDLDDFYFEICGDLWGDWDDNSLPFMVRRDLLDMQSRSQLSYLEDVSKLEAIFE